VKRLRIVCENVQEMSKALDKRIDMAGRLSNDASGALRERRRNGVRHPERAFRICTYPHPVHNYLWITT